MKFFTVGMLGIVLVLAFPQRALHALESVDFYGGIQWIGSPVFAPASDDGAPTGGPSPVLNAYAIDFPFVIGRYFRFVPELMLFGTQYGLIPGYEKTVPVEREYADAIWFLDTLVELSLWLDIPLNNQLGLGATLGAAFLGRIPLIGWGEGWNQLDTMASYLYGQARYLYPALGLFFTWRPDNLDRLEVVVRAKSYLPVFHLWDNEEVRFLDQFMVNASIGLRVYPAVSDDKQSSAPGTDAP